MIHEVTTSSSPAAPPHWECDVVLADGGTVHVRPLRPDDSDRVAAFHAALSDDTVFLRFFSPEPTSSSDEVERFTRVDARTLLYRFTVEDPNTWDKPWTGEYTWPATDELMYEYACQEGNYAMGNILRGARLKETNDAKKTKQ